MYLEKRINYAKELVKMCNNLIAKNEARLAEVQAQLANHQTWTSDLAKEEIYFTEIELPRLRNELVRNENELAKAENKWAELTQG